MAAKARLTYSVQRQFRCSVSRPPSSRPTAPAIPATAPKIANARPRAGLPANVAVTIASAAGASSAPNAPWAARPAARTAKFGAAPASAEAAAKPASPAMKVRLRPSRSDSFPPISSRLPNASA